MNHQKRKVGNNKSCDGNAMLFELPEPRHELCKCCGGGVENHQRYCMDCEYEIRREDF